MTASATSSTALDASALAELAERANDHLQQALSRPNQPTMRLALLDGAGMGVLELPRSTLELLREVLQIQAQGKAPQILATKPMLSTEEAARILRVSRPFIVKEIDEGRINCQRVGRQRRVTPEEIQRYRREHM